MLIKKNKISVLLFVVITIWIFFCVGNIYSNNLQKEKDEEILSTEKYDNAFNCNISKEKHEFYDMYRDENGDILVVSFNKRDFIYYFFENKFIVMCNSYSGKISFLRKGNKPYWVYSDDKIHGERGMAVIYGELLNIAESDELNNLHVKLFKRDEKKLPEYIDDKYIFLVKTGNDDAGVYGCHGNKYSWFHVYDDYVLYVPNNRNCTLFDDKLDKIIEVQGSIVDVEKINWDIEGYIIKKKTPDNVKYYFISKERKELLKDYDLIETIYNDEKHLRCIKDGETKIIDITKL